MSDDEFLQSLIGKPTAAATVVIERGPVSFFAQAVFDDDPAYRDSEAATDAGFDAIPVPPTFPFVMRHWGAFDELQPPDEGEGLQGVIDQLKARGGLILHGEQSFHHHRPVTVGDVLEGRGSIVDAYAKESGGRTMTFIVDETVWRDQATGEPVVSTRFNVIHRI